MYLTLFRCLFTYKFTYDNIIIPEIFVNNNTMFLRKKCCTVTFDFWHGCLVSNIGKILALLQPTWFPARLIKYKYIDLATL